MSTMPTIAQLPTTVGFNLGQSGPRTIVSVYPREQALTLRHDGSKTYTMPAATHGEHQTLTVEDTGSINKNYMTGQFWRAPIAASVVAENLVFAWTRGRVGTDTGLGPGIIVCQSLVPSAEEIQMAKDRQTRYFEFLVHDADARLANDDAKNITDEHRLAAQWMGLGDRQWAKPLTRVELKRCPDCAEEVRGEARKCWRCNYRWEPTVAAAAPASPEPEAVKSTAHTPKKAS